MTTRARRSPRTACRSTRRPVWSGRLTSGKRDPVLGPTRLKSTMGNCGLTVISVLLFSVGADHQFDRVVGKGVDDCRVVARLGQQQRALEVGQQGLRDAQHITFAKLCTA